MKNVHFTSRGTDLRILMWCSVVCFPIGIAFLFPNSDSGQALANCRVMVALIVAGFTGMALGIYNLLKPFGFNRQWNWPRVFVFYSSLLLLITGLALCLWLITTQNTDVRDVAYMM